MSRRNSDRFSRGTFSYDTAWDWFASQFSSVFGSSSKQERKRGEKYSAVEQANMYYDWIMKQEERAYNTKMTQMQWDHDIEMYEQYQSPAAMMRQYQDAGLNPALMYTGGQSIGAPVSSSAQVASGSPMSSSGAPTGEGNPFEIIMGILGMAMQGAQVGSGIREQTAHSKLMEAQADKTNAETAGQNIQNTISSIEAEWLPKFNALKADNLSADTAQKNAAAVLADAETKLKGAQLDKTKVEKALVDVQLKMAQFDESKQQELYNLSVRFQSAQAALEEAKSKTEKELAEKYYQEACLALAKNHELQRFLYDCGVEIQIEEIEAQIGNIEQATTSKKWEPIVGIANSISLFASVMVAFLSRGGFKSLGTPSKIGYTSK